MKTVFIRAIEASVDDKAEVLRRAVAGPSVVRFEVDPSNFAAVPKSPFAYWVSDGLRATFSNHPPFADCGRIAASGGKTLDDFRWIRASWEVTRKGERWVGYAKGGSFSPFYADVYLLLDWKDDAAALKAYLVEYRRSRGWSSNWTAELHGSEHYKRPGLTWPRRTNGLSFRVMPAGCVFGDKGPAAFVERNDTGDLMGLLALANSTAFGALVAVQLARTELAQSFEVGLVQKTPIPNLLQSQTESMARLARSGWSVKRRVDSRAETSHAFLLPALVQVDAHTFIDRARGWAQIMAAAQDQLAALSADIDEHAYCLFGISDEDRQRIENGFGTDAPLASPDDEDDEETDDEAAEVDAAPMVASLLSWSLGAAFGRFDVRLAAGSRVHPPEPEPFAPLPACSPGMLTGGDGLPVAAPPAGYPMPFPTDGIIVDDPGHPRDLIKAVHAVFGEVFDDANARWHEAAELVGARGGNLRDWFARTFFGEHIKRYSKSRRKAPIYWQFATASGSYSVWLYIHRATDDTLFRVLSDFVGPKLDHEREKLDRLTRDAGANPSRTDRDALAAQHAFVDELQALRAEVARVAPLWKPDLDDGVILNFAPLWRLVPQERSWQSECRKAWDKLGAGEYDWAHLAMHLWPERVVPKCAGDRSLAIAHGLEDVFWREDGSGNWHAVDVPEATLLQLVEERTSSSVKAALKDLLAAPAPTGKSGGRRAPSATGRATTPRRAAPAASAPARTSTAEVDEPTLTAVRAAIAAVAEGASKADVQATTGLPDADWNRAIAALLERGDVTRTGQKRGTRYHAKGEPHA